MLNETKGMLEPDAMSASRRLDEDAVQPRKDDNCGHSRGAGEQTAISFEPIAIRVARHSCLIPEASHCGGSLLDDAAEFLRLLHASGKVAED